MGADPACCRSPRAAWRSWWQPRFPASMHLVDKDVSGTCSASGTEQAAREAVG